VLLIKFLLSVCDRIVWFYLRYLQYWLFPESRSLFFMPDRHQLQMQCLQ
jgi:hypothetical protein